MVGMSELQAVFWDMDGTLVDTEPYWIESQHELVEAHGGTWSDEKAHLLVGQALDFSAKILQESGVRMGTEEIITHLIGEVIAKCSVGIPWRPGARELLSDLQAQGVRNALVTMSWKPLAEAIVSALPDGQMEFIVSGDMVNAGKPDPEAYNLAFDTMSQDHRERTGEDLVRERCVAIEDSVPGTAAAAASGMVTLAVPHYTPLPENGQWHLLQTLQGLGTEDLTQLLSKTPAVAAV